MARVTRKKKKPPKPYNPLVDPMMSEAAILARARKRAHDETTAKAALLPSDAVMKQSGESLIASLRGTTDHYGEMAARAGSSYADTTAGAKADQGAAMSQLGVVGGTAAPADTRGGLLGAMAANNLSAMTGTVLGAQQGLPAQIRANAGKRASVQAGEEALYDSYAQAGYDDAIRTAAARQNAALAAATLQSTDAARQAQIRQGDERIDISQQNADTSRMRLDQAVGKAATKEQKDALKEAYKQMIAVLHQRGTGKRKVGASYEFSIPVKPGFENLYPPPKPLSIVVTAKNGTEAFQKFLQQAAAKRAAGLTKNLLEPGAGAQASVYYTGKNTPITEDYEMTGSRSAALHAAISALEGLGAYTHAQAVVEARKLLGSKAPVKKKKTKPKPDRLNAGH